MYFVVVMFTEGNVYLMFIKNENLAIDPFAYAMIEKVSIIWIYEEHAVLLSLWLSDLHSFFQKQQNMRANDIVELVDNLLFPLKPKF